MLCAAFSLSMPPQIRRLQRSKLSLSTAAMPNYAARGSPRSPSLFYFKSRREYQRKSGGPRYHCTDAIPGSSVQKSPGEDVFRGGGTRLIKRNAKPRGARGTTRFIGGGHFTHNEQAGAETAHKSETLARKSEQNGRPTTSIVAEIVLCDRGDWYCACAAARR